MKIKPVTIAALLLFSIGAFAQHNEEVTIEGTYRPKVNKVEKLLPRPETPKPSFEMPGTEVNVLDIEHHSHLDLEKLSPLNYQGRNTQSPDAAQNFLMAGMGSRVSPVFLYKHNSNLTKNLGLGVGIQHYSSWLDLKEYAPSSFMNNGFDIGLASDKNKNVRLDGGIYYKNDMYHYNDANLTEKPQFYNTVGGRFGLASTSTRVGEVRHLGSVDYHYTFDNTFAKEHFVDVDYGIGYAQNWWGNKSHPQQIGVDLAFQYEYFDASHTVGFDPVLGRDDLYLMKVSPFFEMGDEFYKLHLGVRVDGVNRIQNKDKFLGIYPDVSGSLFVMNKKLEFYAGLNGGRDLLTYTEIIHENPFTGCEYGLLAQNVKLGFDGGVRTNIAEVVDLHLGVRYRHTDNDPMFVTEQSSPSKFGLVYDETQWVRVLADLRVKLRNGLTADLGLAYNDCTPTHEEHAWYRPVVEGELKLTCDINDKIALNTHVLYQGGRYAKVWNGSGGLSVNHDAVRMKDVLDLGIGADYRINDQLSVFAKLDNVANQKYQLYYDYPVTGIQFFAGLKLRF